MSGTFSTWLESQLLGHAFARIAYAMPAGLWVALYTTMPGAAGGGGELAATGYARVATTFGPPAGTPPSAANVASIQWPAAPVDWGTIVACGIFDSPAAGNFLGGAGLVAASDPTMPGSTPVGRGDAFRIPTGSLIVGFALAASGAMASRMAPIRAEVVR